MKTRFLPLFLLPTFLIGCNSSWHSINRDKALEIANNIIQYNKHNRFAHLIQDTAYLKYEVRSGDKRLTSGNISHAMYDLDRGYYQNTTIIFGAKSARRVSLKFTVCFVDNSSVISASAEYNVGGSGVGITGEVYPAASENEARKIFENILDGQGIKPTAVLEQLDATLEIIDYCNYMKYSDPTTYGSFAFSAKNNNSLSVKTNYANRDVINDENYVFDCNRCLSHERLITSYSEARYIDHYKTTYDYNTPVKFIPIIDLVEKILEYFIK